MSRFSKPALAATAVFVAAVFTTPWAVGGMDKTAPNGKTTHTKVETMARVPDKIADSTDVFKCWQEGRLIYETRGIDLGKNKLPGATRLKTSESKSLQVLDLKHGMCILDQAR
ncbi:MAG: hypothetical protein WA888_24070 [Burkholderiaceae bacterium]